MSKGNSPETGRRSRVPLVLAFAAACVIAPLAFLVLLPGPPEREGGAGGKITVTKQVPDAAGDSGPEPQSGSGPAPLTGESTAEQGATPPGGDRRALADATRSAPSASHPSPGDRAAAPSGSAGDRSESPDPAGEGTDAPAQASGQTAQESAQDPASEQASTESPEMSSQETPESAAGQATSPSPDEPGEEWRMDLEAAEEPPEASQQASTSAESPTSEEAPASGAGNRPSEAELGGWIESQAKEFLGGVDEEGNILYRFDVWLSAPPALQSKIKSVAYSYDAPSATPESQESVEPRTQFKVSFGALSCAKKITVTITLEDGSTRQTVVNGCQILN